MGWIRVHFEFTTRAGHAAHRFIDSPSSQTHGRPTRKHAIAHALKAMQREWDHNDTDLDKPITLRLEVLR